MAKDYLKQYARKYQEGGMMPAGPEGGAPAPAAPEEGAPQGGGDQLTQMVNQYAQTKDTQLAVAIADALVQMMGVSAAPQGAPMGRYGMKTPKFSKLKK